ncbi:MAG: LysR family transcriptional regulator [Oscillospiraceae bacterium]|nr:LysR family transcriptional regulator [Oscillospiraceae bacterium]
MTLQQLQYLMEVYRTGSVSGAAKNLFLAQSSLSTSISSIESELGFPVFVRTQKGMVPTAQGSHVLAHAARICESYRSMLDTPSLCKRHIRISAPDLAPLNAAFTRLMAAYSGDSGFYFSVDSCCTVEAAKRLAEFELDLAVLVNHEAKLLSVDMLLSEMKLQRQPIATVPAVFLIGKQHRLYGEDALSPEVLNRELFIDNMDDPLLGNDFLKGVIRLSAERTVAVKNANIQRQLLEEGIGYTIAAQTKDSPFRQIPIPGVSYTVSAVTNPKDQGSQAVEDYIRLAKEAFL